MNLTKVISTSISNGKRLIKFQRYGKNDVQEKTEVAPFGIDSNPIKDMVALYAETGTKGKEVIIGYVNKNQLADVGEFRTYSTDENGTVKFYIHQKNDGTCLFGGDADNMVRYSKLEEAFNELKDDFNNFVNTVYNVHQHPTAGTGSPSNPTLTGTQSTADITPSKIDEIKTL